MAGGAAGPCAQQQRPPPRTTHCFVRPLQVPALGESITDGTVSTLLKQPGEAVGEDEPILQIETDKVTIDVRAPHAGTLGQFLVSAWYPSCKQSYFLCTCCEFTPRKRECRIQQGCALVALPCGGGWGRTVCFMASSAAF